MPDHWSQRAPASVLEFDLDSRGEPDPTSQDRRWLGRDLRQYLNETCEHHWHTWDGDEDIPAHRQCSWCCDVEWQQEVADA